MKHLLVTTDFSELADEAIGPACELAARLGAKLTIAHVLTAEKPPQPQPNAPYFKVAQRLWEADQELEANVLASLQERAAECPGITVETAVARGEAIEGILELIRARGIDMIVMSSQGRSGIKRILIGSVTEELARRAPVPVLIWKHTK